MKEHIKKLKELGMKPSEAMQFVREIAKIAYTMGVDATDNKHGIGINSFDSAFSKQLGN